MSKPLNVAVIINPLFLNSHAWWTRIAMPYLALQWYYPDSFKVTLALHNSIGDIARAAQIDLYAFHVAALPMDFAWFLEEVEKEKIKYIVHIDRPYELGFSINDDRRESVISTIKISLLLSSGIITTSDNLISRYGLKHRTVLTLPHCVWFDYYENRNLTRPRNRKKPVVFYAASGHDTQDHNLVANLPANVDGVIYACSPSVFEGSRRWMGFNDLVQQSYYELMLALDADVGLAPLAESELNVYKDDITMLHYAAAEMAIIASPRQPYLSWPRHTFNAAQDDEWSSALWELLDDKALLSDLQQNAHEYARDKRDIKNYIPLFRDMLLSVAEAPQIILPDNYYLR